MFFTDNVNIPDEIVRAQSDGKLVIFVGAGVSIAPPSGLPSFEDLALIVSKDLMLTEYESGRDGSADRYLDRLERDGRPIRDRIVSRLSDPRSRFNDLHSAVVSLFSTIGEVRIVTTNYDEHLSDAVEARFGSRPPVFRAPALPLGYDFNGIVHLHGCLSGRPTDLVITQSDFGRSYLTDAWAARFLNDLFQSEYITLFIGYSHKDVVMSYLAYGLKPGSRRFGLISESDVSDDWRRMQLEEITYPAINDHAELTRALEEWGSQTNMGELGHEQQIRRRVASGPPQTPTDNSYLERSISEEVTAAFFVRCATDVGWLSWIANLDPFPSLFVRGGRLGRAASLLAGWYANFVISDSEEALRLLQEHGAELNEETAWRIVLTLRTSQPDTRFLGRWVAVLIANTGPSVDTELSHLLSHLRWPEDADVGLKLIDHLISPRQELRPSFRFSEGSTEGKTEFDIDILVGDDYSLRKSWTEYFLPHLDSLATPLSQMFENRLLKNHAKLRLVHQANDEYDPQSFSRSGIELNGQDSLPRPVAFLIDGLRDCLEFLLRERVDEGVALILRFENSRAPLLRRLAVHGWIMRADVTDDLKMRHLGESDFLFAFSLKHEVYRLINATIAEARESRLILLGAIIAGPTEEHSLGEELDAHLVLDLLAWTAECAPDFVEAITALSEFRNAQPAIAPSEHLGYDSWSSRIDFSGALPITVAEVLACDSVSDIDELLGQRLIESPVNFLQWSFRIPIVIVTASAQNIGWAKRILDSLIRSEFWAWDFWSPIISGLSRSTTEMDSAQLLEICDQLELVFERCDSRAELDPIAQSICEFLMTVAKISTITAEVIERVESLGATVTSVVSTETTDPTQIDSEDILQGAYNHWTGWLTRFWSESTARRWRVEEDRWSGLPIRTSTALEQLLSASTPISTYPQSILSAQYDFFASADEQWTLNNVRPLFSWQTDADRAARSWSSFLEGGSLNERVLSQLRGDLAPTFHLFRGKRGERLAQRFAEVMVRSTSDFVIDGTLAQFVASSDGDMRRVFTAEVSRLLHQMSFEYAQGQWPRWIQKYVSDRVASQPLPFDELEAGLLLGWVLTSGDHFPDATAVLVSTGARFERFFGVLEDFNERELIGRFPSSVTELLNFILDGSDRETFFSCESVGAILEELLPLLSEGAKTMLLHICDSAARLGCEKAPEWRQAIEARWPG